MKRRSFFVYETDVRLLKAVEDRLARDRRAKLPSPRRFLFGPMRANSLNSDVNSSAMSASYEDPGNAPIVSMRRPRASTSPLLPSLVDDHQVWFDDPRFDGSFPSRVLPFLYLGNLCVSLLHSHIIFLTLRRWRRNHAANAYMLHALGISHVVSVGECALIPPPADSPAGMAVAPCATKMPSPVPASGGSDRRGSLYIEEREGRIKVLDIKGICDDGIDTLEPQLAPICDWIDRAREQGGKVLVHCRVGVSRSATVTIAYVMKYLRISLIEAYLIVRSRRLSVLIQPNMRLLYNLCGWEVKLAHERAAGDTERLRNELARCANWPYLAREVHLLNEKYLHM
jgi:dual specificity MAP kinase phosphatase